MKTENTPGSLRDNRNELFAALRELDPRLCFIIGLVGSAVLAYYIPTIVIALTGVWVNTLFTTSQLIPFLIILVVQNLIGNRLNRLLIVSVVSASIFDCLGAYFILTGHQGWAGWRHWWMVPFQPTVACPLSAWLLLKFKEQTLNR